MCYYFWGIVEDDRDPLPNPHEVLPDWAWAEWVQEQGIGD